MKITLEDGFRVVTIEEKKHCASAHLDDVLALVKEALLGIGFSIKGDIVIENNFKKDVPFCEEENEEDAKE